jgi:glycosyltransferase involved in cell wall biosynthesis
MNATPITGSPTEIKLLIPVSESSFEIPEISIVIPALNEEVTIGEFVDWCWQGLSQAGVSGEIIIVDSSSDDTPNIALAKGARVLRTPKRGLGQAYLDAIPFIRGQFIIMGDCDLTYDFRELKVFVDSFHEGNQYVMGSRFAGSIEDGAMPPLHRYFGTPFTTWILNQIYHSNYGDIHCGMRGLTKEALILMNLTSTGWEYASEMVLKASRLGLSIDQVPVTFYKDREGRFSHHRRAGFWSPWFAGWINLKVMLCFSPDSFLIKPGMAAFISGLFLTLLSVPGTVSVGSIGFNVYMQLLGLTSTVLGYALFQAGILARLSHELREGIDRILLTKASYDRGMIAAGVLFVCGILIDLQFLMKFIINDYLIVGQTNLAIIGLFAFTLLLALERRLRKNIT